MTEKGSTGLSTVLIIIAVAMVSGFLLWLYRSSRALDEEVMPEMAEEEGEAPSAITLLTLSQDPAAAVGQAADIGATQVAQRLGRGVFLIRLTPLEQNVEGAEYPVLLAPDLIARDTQIYGGDVVRVYGHVYSLNDSIRGQWVTAGAVEQASAERIPAVTSFLLADTATVLR